MATLPPLPLASIDAMRPVFMIVMGLTLLLVAWRFMHQTKGWSSWIIMIGAFLLALGYSVILPLYTAKVILPLSLLPHVPQADPGMVMAWHVAKLVSMSGGWMLFGLGLAIHARVFESSRTAATAPATSTRQSEPSLG